MENVRHKRRMSLSAKFSMLTISLILTTSVGVCLFMVQTELKTYYEELLNHGITIAETASQNCELGIYTEDRSALDQVVQGLSKNQDIVYASVLNSNGAVLASSVFTSSRDVPSEPFINVRNATRVTHEDVTSGSDQFIEILYPVESSAGALADPLLQTEGAHEQKIIGHLRLGLSQQGLRKRIRNLLASAAVFTTFLVMLGSLLTIYFARRITRPVASLRAATDEVAKGNFDTPIEIRTTDEIADLASSFDHMRGRLREVHDQLIHDALYDALTGLPNRALFIDRLQHAITYAKRRPGYLFGVLFIDLDGFKLINDSLGHTVGDQLLIRFSKLLAECVRPLDTVSRLGGDEFAVLLEDISGEGNAIHVASRIKNALQQPFAVGGHEIFITGSTGIALSSSGYETPEQFIRDADTAMYRAKAQGRSNYAIFEPAMHAHAVERLQLETELRRGAERGEIVVYYQPILSVCSKHIVGYEALARWQHPERGIVPPGQFIPLAEETGMIVTIERHVLRQACAQMKKWLDLHRSSDLGFVSVNLAHKQIAQPDLVEYVSRVLAETGLGPEHLKLEITENVLFESPASATKLLSSLRDLGVQLYIDDFGTGYSSLSYLHRLPINGLKIDRSFVSRIDAADESNAVIRTIMMLARDMKFDVVAEGVETPNQLAHIEGLACTYWQGFLFSKPVSSADAQLLLAT